MRTEATHSGQQGVSLAPPRLSIGAVGWIRQNLFNTWYNSILTVGALWVVYVIVSDFISWGLIHATFGLTPESCQGSTGACWAFVVRNYYLFMVGTYPYEERWRPFLVYAILIVLGLIAIIPAVRRHTWYRVAWLLSPAVFFLLIRGSETAGLPHVESTLWGGLLLTLVLASAGILLSFPIGLVLALGRRSTNMPVVKALCVGYIELIRGVPLITVLFMSSVMIPMFFPSGFEMDKVLRAQIGIILFSAAYLAEVVRGGLQAIPKGQEEAAMAIGLNYWQRMVLIILPQALRIVIPPLVSSAIGLFKDTSLVVIIGLIDLLGIAGMATANPDWIGRIIEAYFVIGFIYWIFTFNMSRYAARLEERYNVAQR